MRLNHTRGSQVCRSFFSLFFTRRTPFVRGPVRQQTCRTHNATAREEEKLRRVSRWSLLRAVYLFYIPSRSLPLEGDMLNSPIPCLSHYLYRSAFIAVFFEQTMHRFSPIIAFLFFLYMFTYDMLHPYALVRPNTPGA